MSHAERQPTRVFADPSLFFETVRGFQNTAVITAALELDVFTALAENHDTADALASHCGASARGMRMLCDHLVVLGFLTKAGEHYQNVPASLVFLSRRSRTYIGDAAGFLASPTMQAQFGGLTQVVRDGHPVAAHDVTAPDHSVWNGFAVAMGPLMIPVADTVARLLGASTAAVPWKVLDVAAGHGMFGIGVALRHRAAQIVALDWPAVLEVAERNAIAKGVAGRFSQLPGDAFSIELGDGYDVVLLPNFLHHFGFDECVAFLLRIRRALAPGGRVAILELATNSDRVTPDGPARFAITMLATTPNGDAHTLADYRRMLETAGFQRVTCFPAPPSEHTLLIAYRE